MNVRTNFHKWIVFAFPYIVILLHKFLVYALFEYFGIILASDTDDIIVILMNSSAIIFGLKFLTNYTLTKEMNDGLKCKNFLPK